VTWVVPTSCLTLASWVGLVYSKNEKFLMESKQRIKLSKKRSRKASNFEMFTSCFLFLKKYLQNDGVKTTLNVWLLKTCLNTHITGKSRCRESFLRHILISVKNVFPGVLKFLRPALNFPIICVLENDMIKKNNTPQCFHHAIPQDIKADQW